MLKIFGKQNFLLIGLIILAVFRPGIADALHPLNRGVSLLGLIDVITSREILINAKANGQSTLVVPCLPTVSCLPLTLLERLRVCILTPATWYGGNVCLGKILTFEQQRLARRFAQRIRKTVAKVEPGRMATFAKPLIGI